MALQLMTCTMLIIKKKNNLEAMCHDHKYKPAFHPVQNFQDVNQRS